MCADGTTGPRGPLGDHFPRAAVDAVLSHLIRHRICREAVSTSALEYLGQPAWNGLNLGRNLGLCTAVVLSGDTDYSTSIDDVVWSVQNTRGLQRLTVFVFRQLVVRGSGDDACTKTWDATSAQNRTQCARRKHFDVFRKNVFRRYRGRLELITHSL